MPILSNNSRLSQQKREHFGCASNNNATCIMPLKCVNGNFYKITATNANLKSCLQTSGAPYSTNNCCMVTPPFTGFTTTAKYFSLTGSNVKSGTAPAVSSGQSNCTYTNSNGKTNQQLSSGQYLSYQNSGACPL